MLILDFNESNLVVRLLALWSCLQNPFLSKCDDINISLNIQFLPCIFQFVSFQKMFYDININLSILSWTPISKLHLLSGYSFSLLSYMHISPYKLSVLLH